MLPIYHLATAECWNRHMPGEDYVPDAFAKEGFVHCCTAEQLPGVASRYYKGAEHLVLLVIDRDRLGAELIFENTVGGSEQFPHLYGSVNRDAVLKAQPCAVTSDGDFAPPLAQMGL